MKIYIEKNGQSNNQFDQLIAPVVIFYSTKSRLHIDGDTTITVDTTKYGFNDTASTASKTGLVFLKMSIAKILDNNIAADLSKGADSAATAQ